MKQNNGVLCHIENYKFNSLLFRNFCVVFLFAIIPIIVIGIITYFSFMSVTDSEISTINRESALRISDVVDLSIKQIKNIAINSTLQSDVKVFCLNNKADDAVVKSITRYIKNFIYSYQYIDSIYVFSENNKYILSDSGISTFDTFDDSKWSDAYYSGNRMEVKTIIRKKSENYPYLITIIKSVTVDNENIIGAVVINIDLKKFGSALIQDNYQSNHQNVIVMDENDNIVYNQNEAYILKNISQIGEFRGINDIVDNTSKKINVNGQSNIVSSYRSEYSGWNYISYVVTEYYANKTASISYFMILICVVSFLLVLVVSYLISLKMFRPIENIVTFIETKSTGENFISNSYEVNYIKEILSKTFQNNDDIKNELEEQFAANNTAQLLALQSQINPHFLYNTLETLQWKAIELTDSENDVSEMVYLLGKLLKISLDTGNNLISIKEEICNTQIYVDLLNKRYSDYFSLEWDIDSAILECKIIKLSLQPLIENAVYHGLKPAERKGIIRIIGKLENEEVILKVEDNGVGISNENLLELNERLKSGEYFDKNHIGIKNVHKRLKILFGEQYGVTVLSEINSGTTAKITIPKI